MVTKKPAAPAAKNKAQSNTAEATEMRFDRFVEAYLECWVGTEAARRAGYKQPEVAASRLLRNDKVRAKIQARLDDLKAEADMVIAQLTNIARGSMGNYVKITPIYEEMPKHKEGESKQEPKIIGFKPVPDYERWERNMSNIKKLTFHPDGSVTIELYNKLQALNTLARIHGLVAAAQVDVDWRVYLTQIGLEPDSVFNEFQRMIENAALSAEKR